MKNFRIKFNIIFILPICFLIINSCSIESVDQVESVDQEERAVPIEVVRAESRFDFNVAYEGKKIISFEYLNTRDIWSYDGDNLIRIDMGLTDPPSEDFEKYIELLYDESNRLVQFFYKQEDRFGYFFSRTDIEYSNGRILKQIYSDQSTTFGPQDGILEFVRTETILFENGNVIEIDSGEEGSKRFFTYGSEKSPFVNVDNFEILQVLFSSNINLLYGIPELFMGVNNLETQKYSTVVLEQFYDTEYGQNTLPSKIEEINQVGSLKEIVTIRYQ